MKLRKLAAFGVRAVGRVSHTADVEAVNKDWCVQWRDWRKLKEDWNSDIDDDDHPKPYLKDPQSCLNFYGPSWERSVIIYARLSA